MSVKLDKYIKSINDALYKRDEYVFKIITSEDSKLSRQMTSISYIQNELSLYSLLRKKEVIAAVRKLPNVQTKY